MYTGAPSARIGTIALATAARPPGTQRCVHSTRLEDAMSTPATKPTITHAAADWSSC